MRDRKTLGLLGNTRTLKQVLAGGGYCQCEDLGPLQGRTGSAARLPAAQADQQRLCPNSYSSTGRGGRDTNIPSQFEK